MPLKLGAEVCISKRVVAAVVDAVVFVSRRQDVCDSRVGAVQGKEPIADAKLRLDKLLLSLLLCSALLVLLSLEN